MTNQKWLDEARLEDPSGYYCYQCKEVNTNVDDCGFWYQKTLDGSYSPLCEKCFDWSKHVGER